MGELAVSTYAVEASDWQPAFERKPVCFVLSQEHRMSHRRPQPPASQVASSRSRNERLQPLQTELGELVVGHAPHRVSDLATNVYRQHCLALGRKPGHGEGSFGDP